MVNGFVNAERQFSGMMSSISYDERERETERETDRQRDRQTDRQTDARSHTRARTHTQTRTHARTHAHTPRVYSHRAVAESGRFLFQRLSMHVVCNHSRCLLPACVLSSSHRDAARAAESWQNRPFLGELFTLQPG